MDISFASISSVALILIVKAMKWNESYSDFDLIKAINLSCMSQKMLMAYTFISPEIFLNPGLKLTCVNFSSLAPARSRVNAIR